MWIFVSLVAVSIILFIVINKIRKNSRSSTIDKVYFKKKWKEIEDMAAMNKEMAYKMAIVEADKLLDHALKVLGTPGSTMGERLKVKVYKYPNLRRVWDAHSVRNAISHESNYKLFDSTARKSISTYKDALKELGIL